jgi:hypothetical protein
MSKKEEHGYEPLVDVSGFKENYQNYARTPIEDPLAKKTYAIAARIKQMVEEEEGLDDEAMAAVKKRLEDTVNRVWRIAIDTQLLKTGRKSPTTTSSTVSGKRMSKKMRLKEQLAKLQLETKELEEKKAG